MLINPKDFPPLARYLRAFALRQTGMTYDLMAHELKCTRERARQLTARGERLHNRERPANLIFTYRELEALEHFGVTIPADALPCPNEIRAKIPPRKEWRIKNVNRRTHATIFNYCDECDQLNIT